MQIGSSVRHDDWHNRSVLGYSRYCLPKDTEQPLACYDKIPQNLVGAIADASRSRIRSEVVNTALTLAAICAGVASGSLAVLAALVSAAYCVNPVATFWYLGRAFGRPALDFASEFSAQLGMAVAMLSACACIRAGLTACMPGGAAVILLAAKVACCFAAYAVLLVVTGQWRNVSTLARWAR